LGCQKRLKHPILFQLFFLRYIKAGVEIARVIGSKRVLPKSDSKILRELEDITDFRVLQRKIQGISDTEVRHILEKYILRYIRRF